MQFALVFIGLVLIITGAKDTYKQLGAQLRADFTGSGNFTYWLASIGFIGALGYVPSLRVFSRMFMTLILLVLILQNKGFFANFTAALRAGPESIAPDQATAATANADTVSSGIRETPSAPTISAPTLGLF